MIERISQRILKILSDENDSEEQKEILLFGIIRIIEDIPKYIGMFIICLLLGIAKEFFAVMAVTVLYKTFTGGVHLHTNIGCFIGSMFSVLSCIYIPHIVSYFQYNNLYIAAFVYIFSIYIIWVYVPADVPEIPIINENRRKRDKIMSFLILNLLYIIAFFVIKSSVYMNIVFITIFSIDLMTTRTMYKIFKNHYGYETYVPDELLILD